MFFWGMTNSPGKPPTRPRGREVAGKRKGGRKLGRAKRESYPKRRLWTHRRCRVAARDHPQVARGRPFWMPRQALPNRPNPRASASQRVRSRRWLSHVQRLAGLQRIMPSPQRKPRATKAEKVTKPKSPIKPKAKAKAKSASARASSSKRMANMAKTKHSELFDGTLTDQLSAFAKTFSPDSDFKSDVFKTFMRSQVDPPENFPLNIYWTSASCGCKDKAQSKDIHSFTFNSVPSPHVYRLAVAVKCAELSAAHFAYKGFQDKTLQARKCLRWLKQMAFLF